MGSGKNHSLPRMRQSFRGFLKGESDQDSGYQKAVKSIHFLAKCNLSPWFGLPNSGLGPKWILAIIFPIIASAGCQYSAASQQNGELETNAAEIQIDSLSPQVEAAIVLDTLAYNKLYAYLTSRSDSIHWATPTVLPRPGAILPFKRIVAYYGNLYSKGMGVLGALPEAEMLSKLLEETRLWTKADSLIPAIPALHYITVTAQRDPGRDGQYRLRMPGKEIDKILEMAKSIDALVFLDIQIGHSRVQDELPLLKEYLRLPNVHLGIDPEYSMKDGSVPGVRVGTMDAEDINFASEWLAQLVRDFQLPPKILIVHRFKRSMITGYKEIKLHPEVQMVINMDGFGSRGKKLTTYKQCITAEPVQFTGFKLFYKNDTIDPAKPYVMQPEEILKLYPKPIYIQYQ